MSTTFTKREEKYAIPIENPEQKMPYHFEDLVVDGFVIGKLTLGRIGC
jgi:hypothetical protein